MRESEKRNVKQTSDVSDTWDGFCRNKKECVSKCKRPIQMIQKMKMVIIAFFITLPAPRALIHRRWSLTKAAGGEGVGGCVWGAGGGATGRAVKG